MKAFKSIVFIGLLLFLFAPLIQKKFAIIRDYPLYGSFYPPQTPKFSLYNWRTGTYQEKKAIYFDYYLGLRNDFIRIQNQYLFSLFRKSTSYASVGANQQLFAFDYYDTYRGTDFLGTDSIQKLYNNLLLLKQKLDNLNKPLLFVIAPNKVRVYKNYIPSDRINEPGIQTNYATWRTLLAEGKIPYIDFNEYFIQVEDTGKYHVYPNTGIHWNSYGMHLALDTMTQRLEALNITRPLLKFNWLNVEMKDSLIDGNRDLVDGLNLAFYLPTKPQPYPNVRLEGSGWGALPRTLIVGDSFFWNFYALGDVFNEVWHPDSRFWYYNNTQKDMAQGSKDSVVNLNAHDMINHLDYVLLMATESNLDIFPYGFVEKFLKEEEQDSALAATKK